MDAAENFINNLTYLYHIRKFVGTEAQRKVFYKFFIQNQSHR